jgi:methionyl-tRNA synthetase
MTAVHLKAGLKLVMELSSEGNKFMQDTKPWDLMKGGAQERCATVITLVASLVRILAAVAEPFMPGFTDKVVHILDLPHADIPDEFTVCIPDGHVILKPTPLFSAIPPAQVASLREQFSGAQVLGSSASPDRVAAAAAAATASGGAAASAVGFPAAVAASAKAGGGAAKKPASGSGGGAAAALPDIAQIDLRVGHIVRAWAHPEAEKLWCEEIDLGEGKPRTIASGLRQFYSLEQMQGRRVVVVANLKPRTMVGFESQGMVLCAASADRRVVEFVEPPAGARVGERIRVAGVSESTEPAPETVNPAKKGNPWLTVAPVRAR